MSQNTFVETVAPAEPIAVDPSAAPAKLRDFKLNRRLQAVRSFIHFLCRVNPRIAIRVWTVLFLRPRRRPIAYLEQLPAGARPLTIVHNLQHLHGYEWGDGEKTVLLVHGWESHLGHMLPFVEPLLNAGYRVIAFDGPGHGQSPQLLTNMYDFGEAVRCAIEQHTPQMVIAKSFGGGATALMLARQPNLSLERLVLVSPMAHIRQHIDIFDQLAAVPDEVMPHFLAEIERRVGTRLQNLDVIAAVHHLKLPMLLVHDCHDTVIEVNGSRTIAQIAPNATLMETVGLGHKGIVRNKQVTRRVVDFLDGAICGRLP